VEVFVAVRELPQLEEQLDGSGYIVGAQFLDIGATARFHLDEPADVEDANRLTDNRAADPQALGQVSLAGELIARSECLLDDQALNLFGDLLVEPVAANREVEGHVHDPSLIEKIGQTT
jgi:hypothetical protein